jgi:hypothetical protein
MNQQMINEIQALRNNKTVMDFVEREAYEKVASDLNEKSGGATTWKGARQMSYYNRKVQERVNQYIAAGLVGCLMAKCEA